MDENEFQNLVSDFARNYLTLMGVSEEEAADENGNLKEEYVNMFSQLIPSLSEEFWKNYAEDPETAITSLIESQKNQEDQTALAKKGMKLKKLQKYQTKSTGKKCKCGCDIVLKRAGGKMVEVCACGCKNSKAEKDKNGGNIQNKKENIDSKNNPNKIENPITDIINKHLKKKL